MSLQYLTFDLSVITWPRCRRFGFAFVRFSSKPFIHDSKDALAILPRKAFYAALTVDQRRDARIPVSSPIFRDFEHTRQNVAVLVARVALRPGLPVLILI